ncbi:MAG: glycosyltransferase [Syntrophomonadaceae bacterium]
MRVLQINSVCGIGSTGRIATDIHNILIEQGHESYIAYGRDLPKNCENAISIGSKIDNYAHVAKTRLLDKHGFGSKQATIEFIDKVKELNPDIIHLHNIHGYYINIEILFEYLKEANKPIVWTLHDCWSFTGHCSHFSYVGCEKWKSECFDCPQKKEYPKSIFLDNSRLNFKMKKDLFTGVKNMTIVTPSKWLGELVKGSFLKDYRIKVINNGIDLSTFKLKENDFRRDYKLGDKFIILGVASIWGHRKGIEFFLELSSKLKEDEVIVLVGLSSKQLNEMPDNILGISRTNSVEQLAEIYSSADVFVNPTLEDTFPTTNLEALACGTPVITFDTGGSPESVRKETGLVVNKKDVYSLNEAILNIKNLKLSPDDCIKSAEQFQSTDRFKEYLDLYKYALFGGDKL